MEFYHAKFQLYLLQTHCIFHPLADGVDAMTRRHFKALAEQLRTIKPASIGEPKTIERERFAMWTLAVEAAIETCRQFNARFNADKFRDACGWN